MPRLTKIYTKTGDGGLTSLGSGQRVGKDTLRIEAYGTVDELNSQIGFSLSGGLDGRVAAPLTRVQNDLFHLGSDLCILQEHKSRLKVPQIEERHIKELELLIDELGADLGPLENFILPGGSTGAAGLHLARTVCRRAERILVALARKEAVNPLAVKYINRLSDALFVMARYENKSRGIRDIYWNSRA